MLNQADDRGHWRRRAASADYYQGLGRKCSIGSPTSSDLPATLSQWMNLLAIILLGGEQSHETSQLMKLFFLYISANRCPPPLLIPTDLGFTLSSANIQEVLFLCFQHGV